MITILPDFTQATFESSIPIDNLYFPLTPGTVQSYQGAEYELEEINETLLKQLFNNLLENAIYYTNSGGTIAI